MSSHSSKLLISIEKFDGTNWEDWSYSIRSTFRLSHILCIAEGTELWPATSANPTNTELRAIDVWDQKNEEGLGLIQLAVKPSIRQSIKENETLAQNWTCLKETYGTHTGLDLWVDITKYFSTLFSPQQPLAQQIDGMSELKSRIDTAGMTIPDSLLWKYWHGRVDTWRVSVTNRVTPSHFHSCHHSFLFSRYISYCSRDSISRYSFVLFTSVVCNLRANAEVRYFLFVLYWLSLICTCLPDYSYRWLYY